eukprot:jgi/Ulvmu1/5776/UM025_0030.1
MQECNPSCIQSAARSKTGIAAGLPSNIADWLAGTDSLGITSNEAASPGKSSSAAIACRNPYGSVGSSGRSRQSGQQNVSSALDSKFNSRPSSSEMTSAASSPPCEVHVTTEQDSSLTQISSKHDQVVMRLPGELQGSPVAVQGLHGCDVYLLDTCGQLLVDSCTGCTFAVGPVAGSVFIRDCSTCRFHVVCQQLRLRSVASSTLALHCRTRPIIESSSGLRFACWDTAHAALPAQLTAAGLSPFHNFWSRVYDFTPAPPGGVRHWEFADPDEAQIGTLGMLCHAVPAEVQALMDSAVVMPTFVTHGERPAVELWDECGAHLCVFLTSAGLAHAGMPPTDFGAAAAMAEIADGYALLRTNKAELTAAAAEQMRRTAPQWREQEGALAAAIGATVWGFEISGASNDAAERRAARFGAFFSEDPATAAPFRELGLTG